jgi:hypothetical protein
MFVARFEFLYGGFVIPQVDGLQHLQFPFSSYSVSLTEVGIVLLAFSVSAILYTFATKKLALEEAAGHA